MILNLAAFVAFGRITIALTLLVFYLYPAGRRGGLDALVRRAARPVGLDGPRALARRHGARRRRRRIARADRPARHRAGVPRRHGAGVLRARRAARLRARARHRRRRSSPWPAPRRCTWSSSRSARSSASRPSARPRRSRWPAPRRSSPVVLAGVIGAGVPTLAFITGIRRLGPSQAAILATLEPVIGVGAGRLAAGRAARPRSRSSAARSSWRPRSCSSCGRDSTADHEAVATRDEESTDVRPDDFDRGPRLPLLWLCGPFLLGAVLITAPDRCRARHAGLPEHRAGRCDPPAARCRRRSAPGRGDATFDWDRVCVFPPDGLRWTTWTSASGSPGASSAATACPASRQLLVFVRTATRSSRTSSSRRGTWSTRPVAPGRLPPARTTSRPGSRLDPAAS